MVRAFFDLIGIPPETIALLVGLTIGAVLNLFLFIILIGYRQRRSYEALLAGLFFSLFLGCASVLLSLNAMLQYELAPNQLRNFAGFLGQLSTYATGALLVHASTAYQKVLSGHVPGWMRTLRVATYAVTVFLVMTRAFWALFPDTFAVMQPMVSSVRDPLLIAMLVGAAIMQLTFATNSTVNMRDRRFHYFTTVTLVLIVLSWTAVFALGKSRPYPPSTRFEIQATLGMVSYLGVLLVGSVFAYNLLRPPFMRLAPRRNLIFAVVSGFGAVLYLTLASRISQWLEPWFPPVATISILVFVLVFLYEPLQRALSRGLQRLMREEVEKVQRVLTAVHNEARGGELARLLGSAEARIREEFTLEAARIVLRNEGLREGPARPAVTSANVQRFPMYRNVGAARWVARSGEPPARPYKGNTEEIGVLEAYFHGGMLSGETHAALETLAAQLPAAIDLCRAIEEKLTLERELAERERLAMLGQMAASISHSLKNPLGSMKTLLQVQLENPELPEAVRRDSQLVVAEVDRLSAKLNQLLRYAKPGLRESGAHAQRTDLSAATAQVIELLRREAQQRGIAMWLDRPPGEIFVRGIEEALSDVLQNLIVNAIEATPPRGAVRVTLTRDAARAQISVSDEGPGIPADVQAKIFQPFFTTKPQGTGLGLAIVQRRLAEIGGSIECRSPAASGRGTEFVVMLPLSPEGLATDKH